MSKTNAPKFQAMSLTNPEVKVTAPAWLGWFNAVDNMLANSSNMANNAANQAAQNANQIAALPATGGGTFVIATGANSVTVSDSNVTANTVFSIAPTNANAAALSVYENISARVPGTSFTVVATANALANSSYSYVRVH